ncbi:MAG TPA: hypothetical protein VE645_01775 [Pseudonocardiaceae bacterium]|jgi:hypothetical protein|nr:hypothetical protein [Pseudonocardiaceae bacterium]
MRSPTDHPAGAPRRQIAPFKGCWPLLAAVLAGMAYDGIVTAGALFPTRRQGLHDRLAHVVVLPAE